MKEWKVNKFVAHILGRWEYLVLTNTKYFWSLWIVFDRTFKDWSPGVFDDNMVGMDKAQPIRLHQFYEFDGDRAKNGTQPKQYGSQCNTVTAKS